MNPLDWNGPDFLALYVPLLAGGLIAAMLLRLYLRQPGGEPPLSATSFSPYELALLNGATGPVNAA